MAWTLRLCSSGDATHCHSDRKNARTHTTRLHCHIFLVVSGKSWPAGTWCQGLLNTKERGKYAADNC